MIQNIRIVKASDSIYQTLILMKQLELESLNDVNFIRYCNYYFYYLNNTSIQQLKIFHEWINDKIKYKTDEYDETLISPRIFPNYMFGDCDDISLFAKTILDYFGYKTNYILLGNKTFTHIALIIKLNNQTIYFDGVSNNFNLINGKYKIYKIIS